MSEMIERVAKALFSGSVYHGYNKGTLDAEWFRMKGIHMAQAKAAIEAMREPSQEMIDVVRQRPWLSEAINDYRAMIDEALK